MNLLRTIIALCTVVATSSVSAQAQDLSTAKVWFNPRSSIPVWNYYSPDFLRLFQPNAPWQHAAAHIAVFKLYSQFAGSSIPNGGSTDSDLKTVIDFLQQHRIALGIEGGLLTNKDLCGKVEGYCGEQIEPIVARIKRLGGDLSYVAMDEPLWFGHESKLPLAPHASIESIAQNVAVQVATIHKYFPNAQVGDTEPVDSPSAPPNYIADVMHWTKAYQAATGQPLAFFNSDVAWQSNGDQPQLVALSKLMRANGIRFGIIYNGNPEDQTSIAWINNAEQHFVNVEADPSMIPDNAIIQTWVSQPDHLLPETQPGAMTYLINRYHAAETTLHVDRVAFGFKGSLSSYGKPVNDAQVVAYEIDDGSLNIPSQALLESVVPSMAVTAVVGLRINTECDSKGTVGIRLGSTNYIDKKTAVSLVQEIVPPLQILLGPEQTQLKNSPRFPVVTGDPFSLSVPMQASYSSRNHGYVAIMFLDANGKEVSRMKLPFEPGKRLIYTGRTDRRGEFVVSIPNNAAIPSIVTFNFPGTENLRLSSVTSVLK